MRKIFAVLISLIAMPWACAPAVSLAPSQLQVSISPADALAIGRKIWNNECGMSIMGLTHWNQGEDFASMGIGHFIWYHSGKPGPFVESFPMLLDFLQKRGADVPDWLRAKPPCPWNSREEFARGFNSKHMRQIRALLAGTVDLQTQFLAQRLEESLPKMLEAEHRNRRDRVLAQFRRVYSSPGGLYPLMDYVNFKGEGTSESERYNGQGWGLLQVLENMRGTQPGAPALAEFARAADFVLERRVKNSPPKRGEKSWLSNWERRVSSYARS